MFINGIKFLLTVSRNIDFVTAQYVLRKKYSGYIKPIEVVCNMYAKRGFAVTTILANPEFKHLETFLDKMVVALGISLQTVTQFNQPSMSLPKTSMLRKQKKRSVLSRTAPDPCDLPFPCSKRFHEC